jgi:hypothetical protein
MMMCEEASSSSADEGMATADIMARDASDDRTPDTSFGNDGRGTEGGSCKGCRENILTKHPGLLLHCVLRI